MESGCVWKEGREPLGTVKDESRKKLRDQIWPPLEGCTWFDAGNGFLVTALYKQGITGNPEESGDLDVSL
jgi:hypothetical protein